MYHTIETTAKFTVDLETSPSKRLERLSIREGTLLRVQLQPRVIESDDGPIEVADLYFEDGTTARQIPFARFRFVERP